MVASRSSLFFFAAIAGFSAATARAGAVVDPRAGRFRGMRRQGREGGDEGGKTASLAECNAKFAGRRKPGGGYTYFDFMQNRSFDIAGPEPDAAKNRRRSTSSIPSFSTASGATASQPRSRRSSNCCSRPPCGVKRCRCRWRRPTRRRRRQAIGARAKAANCARHSFSCEWPRLSESLKDLKKLFSSSPGKAKRG